MKISLILIFTLSVLSLGAQGEDLFPEIKNLMTLPFQTPDELPIVGYMADEAMEYAESEKEREELLKIAHTYPDVTERFQQLVGDDSELTNPDFKLNAFGKFILNDLQYFLLIETSLDENLGFPTQSLVIIAFSKNTYYYDELYVKSDYVYQEFDNDGNTIFHSTLTNSKLEEKEGTLFITSNEEYSQEFVGEEETVVLDHSTTVNHYKFKPVDNYFELFLIEK